MPTTEQASAIDRRVDWFLSDQGRAGVRVNSADYLRIEPRESVVVATVLAEGLEAVTHPNSPGALFRTALYQVMHEAAQAGKGLVIDLAGVKYLNTESAFTLDDAHQFMQSRGLRVVLTGITGEVGSKLRVSEGAIGVSRERMASAPTVREAEQLAIAA